MDGKMSYIVTVELQRLNDLKELRDTLMEIQQLSREGATFNVRLNSNIVNNVTEDVANAVTQGIEKGAAKSRVGVPGATVVTGGGGGGGGGGRADTAMLARLDTLIRLLSGEKPGGRSQEHMAARIEQHARIQDNLINNLRNTLDQLGQREQKRTPLTRAEMEQVMGVLPKEARQRYTGLYRDASNAAETGNSEIMEQVSEQIRREFSPQKIQKMVKERLERIMALKDSGYVPAEYAASGSTTRRALGGTSVAPIAFDYDKMRGAVETGVFNAMKRAKAYMGGSSGGEGPAFERDTVRDNETEEAFEAYGPSRFAALTGSIQRLDSKMNDIRLRLEVATGKEKTALQEQLNAIGSNMRDLREQRALLAQNDVSGAGFREGIASRSLDEAYARAKAMPNSLAAKSFARGGRTLGALSDAERSMVLAAADSRVVGVTGLFDQFKLDDSGYRETQGIIQTWATLRDQKKHLESKLTTASGNPSRSKAAAAAAEGIERITQEQEALEVRMARQTTLSSNRLISGATDDYENYLRKQRAQEKMGQPEFQAKMGELIQSTTQLDSVADSTSPIREYLTLIPEALARFIKRTLEKYVSEINETGSASAETKEAIASNRLLKQITGEDFKVVESFTRNFGDQLSVFQNVQGLPPQGLIPPEGADPDQLRAFKEARMAAGARLAVSTQDRRAYALSEVGRLGQELSGMKEDDFRYESLTRSKEAFDSEILLGGRLFYPDAPRDRLISNERLLSPNEARIIQTGAGMRSPDFDAEGVKQMTGEEKAVDRMSIDMESIAKSMERMSAAAKQLSEGGLGPVAKVLQDMAEPLAKVTNSLSFLGRQGNAAAQRSALSVVTAAQKENAIQGARTAGKRDRATVDQEIEDRKQAIRLFEQAKIEKEAQEALDLRLKDADLSGGLTKDDIFAQLSKTRGRLVTSQDKQTNMVDLLTERQAQGLPIATGVRGLEGEQAQYMALTGRFARDLLKFDEKDPLFFGERAKNAATDFLDQQEQTRAVGSEASQLKLLQQQEQATAQQLAAVRRQLNIGEDAKKQLDLLNTQKAELAAQYARYNNAVRAEERAAGEVTRLLGRRKELRTLLEAGETPELKVEFQTVRRQLSDAQRDAAIAQATADAQRTSAAKLFGMDYNERDRTLFNPKLGTTVDRGQLDADFRGETARLDTEVVGARNAAANTGNRNKQLDEAQKLADQLASVNGEILRVKKNLETMVGVDVVADEEKLNNLLREQQDLLQKRAAALTKATEDQFRLANQGGGVIQSFTDKLKNLSYYVSAGAVVYTVASQLRQALTAAVGVEADLTRIQGVLEGRSASGRSEVRRGVFEAASDFGTPLQQSIQAAKLFAQTGASAPRTVELTRASLAAQVGADLPAGQATELLVAAENITSGRVQGFDVLDRISRIEAEYAVSATDLSQAIQRAGSIASQLQTTSLGSIDALDTVIGAATAIIERTRVSGNQAATSLRFIFSRLAAPEVAKKLQNDFGIALAGPDSNTLRPLQDILSDIAGKYKELQSSDTVRAQQLLVSFAGARQVNAAAALLDNFNYAIEVATESSLAYGDTQARVKLQVETLEATYTKFQTSLAGFTQRLLEDSGVGFVAKTGLQAGTAILSQQTAAGSVGIGGAALGLGYAATAGSLKLAEFVGREVLPGRLAGARVGLGALSKVLSVVGTFGLGVGGGLLVTAGIEGLFRAFKFVKDLDKFQRFEEFDEEAFQKSPFFQQFSSTATGLGLTPGDYAAKVAEAGNLAIDDIKKNFGANALDKTFNNRGFAKFAEEALRERFREAFPEMGLESNESLTAIALEQLRRQYQYNQAPGQQVVEQARAKSDELLDRFQKAAEGDYPHLQLLRGSLFNAGFLKGDAVSGFADVDLRTAAGSFADIRSAGPRGASQFFRENIVISKENLLRAERIRAVEAELRLTKKNLTEDELLLELKKRYRKEFDKGTPGEDGAARDLIRKVQNQNKLAVNVAEGIENYIELDRVSKGGLSTAELDRADPDAVILEGLKQVFATARTELERRFAKASTPQEQAAIKALFDQLARAESRPRTIADLNSRKEGTFLARERILEPFIQYGVREQGIAGSVYLRDRFGVGFNETQARSDSGVELLRQISTIRPTVLGEVARLGLRLGLTPSTAQAARDLAESDEGRQVGIGDISGIAPILNPDDQVLTRETGVRQLEAYRTQLKITEEGFGSFMETILTDPKTSKTQREGVLALRDSLGELLSASKTLTLDDVGEILKSAKGLEALREALSAFIEPLVDAANNQRLISAALQAKGVSAGVNAEIRAANLQQDTQLALASIGIRGRPQDTLVATIAGIQAVSQDQLLAAEERNNQRLAQIQDAYNKSGDETAFAEALLEWESSGGDERRRLSGDTERQQRQALSDYINQIEADRRGQAEQLYTSVTDPFKTLFQSSRNFNAQGYQQVVEGVAGGFQSRLVDSLFETLQNTGLGQQILTSFESGALYTRQAIVSGFLEGSQLMRYVGMDGNLTAAAGAAVAGLPLDLVQYDAETGTFGSIANASIGGTSKGLKGFSGKKLFEAALPVGGTLLGGTIGGRDTFSQEGASIGGGIGAIFGPWGGFAGGILGGALGSLFGKNSPKPMDTITPLERIERNTREAVQAIENQTKLLTLDSRFVNAPAGFVLPGYTPFGATGGSAPVVNAQITINAQANQSAEQIAQQVVRQLGRELSVVGASLDLRG